MKQFALFIVYGMMILTVGCATTEEFASDDYYIDTSFNSVDYFWHTPYFGGHRRSHHHDHHHSHHKHHHDEHYGPPRDKNSHFPEHGIHHDTHSHGRQHKH